MEPIIQNSKIEKILGSLDGIKRAEVPAFFFERIQAKLSEDRTPYLRKIKRTFPSPVLAITIVPFVILLDFAAFQWQEKKDIVTADYNDFRLSLENDLGETLFFTDYTEPETADAFDLQYY